MTVNDIYDQYDKIKDELPHYTHIVFLKDTQPCDHIGCVNHVTHPCEKCKRIAAKGESTVLMRIKRG